jgi:hypothetical protein
MTVTRDELAKLFDEELIWTLQGRSYQLHPGTSELIHQAAQDESLLVWMLAQVVERVCLTLRVALASLGKSAQEPPRKKSKSVSRLTYMSALEAIVKVYSGARMATQILGLAGNSGTKALEKRIEQCLDLKMDLVAIQFALSIISGDAKSACLLPTEMFPVVVGELHFS